MASYHDVSRRWTNIVLDRTDARPLHNQRMPIRGDRIYSYGSHFELARLVRPKSGEPFFLLNGDTYSVTTAKHQREIRDAVAATDTPSLILPHSAASRAGIVLDSIRPVAIDAERMEETLHTLILPDGTGADLLARAEARCRENVAALRAKLAAEDAEYGYRYGTAEGSAECKAPDGSTVKVTIYGASYDYGELYDHQSAGWRVKDESEWRPCFYRNGAGLTPTSNPDKFHYTTYRHFLGASVFSAQVSEWHEAESFRIRKSEDTGERWASGLSRREVRDYSSDSIVGEVWHVYTARTLKTRRAYFVSAFDEPDNHGRPLYFLAELPKDARPFTVEEALDSLAPEDVRRAIREGAEVKRQGDIFAVPASDVVARLPIPFRYPDKATPVALGSTTGSHTASESVTIRGALYARGVIRHDEHKWLRLGKEWHRLYRNRVPLAREGVYSEDGRRFGWQAPGTPRAWSIAGRID